MRVSFFVFFVITLTTHLAIGQGLSRLSSIKSHQEHAAEQMTWANELLNSGMEGKELDSITDESGYTPLMISVFYVVGNASVVVDFDAWEGLMISLLQAGASPTQPVLRVGIFGNEYEITPLREAMKALRDGIDGVLWHTLNNRYTDAHDERVYRVTMALIRAKDGFRVF